MNHSQYCNVTSSSETFSHPVNLCLKLCSTLYYSILYILYCMFCHKLNWLASLKLHFPCSSHDVKCNLAVLVHIMFWLWNILMQQNFIHTFLCQRLDASNIIISIDIMYVLLSVDNYVSPETRPWRENSVRIVNTYIITPRWKYSCWKFPHRITACYLAQHYSIFPSIRVLLGNPCDELCNMCFYHAVL